ncbi:MAG: ATP-grasp domain-containing protein, partial [Candidatus Binataceae bacterium]
MALSTNSGAANKPRVLIAGIAGASLGTELAKSLAQAGRYEIIGCDISPLAFGHYDPTFHRTFVIDHGNYIESVLQLCSREKIEVVVPGAEEVNTVMAAAAARFAAAGLKLAINTPEVIAKFGNKSTTFSELSRLGFRVPKTADCSNPAAFNAMTYPCVVKSTIGSGGNLVFLAGDREEAILRSQYVLRNAAAGVLQEYIDDTEGEFTVAVLSLPDGRLVCSIALQRFFAAKLSVKLRDAAGLISSPYSQGLIDDFPTVREQAERIAVAIGSRGPLDIQG